MRFLPDNQRFKVPHSSSLTYDDVFSACPQVSLVAHCSSLACFLLIARCSWLAAHLVDAERHPVQLCQGDDDAVSRVAFILRLAGWEVAEPAGQVPVDR